MRLIAIMAWLLFVVTPGNGGAACPALTETRAVTEACGSAGGNPDNWPLATQTFVARDYNTQRATDMWPETDPVVRLEYMPTGGFNGSGAWKVIPTPGPAGIEDNAGWNVGSGFPAIPAGVDTLVFYDKIYLSGRLLDAIATRQNGFWAHSNKTLDIFMRVSPSGGFDKATRQVIGLSSENGVPKFSHMKGGAGVRFIDDRVNVNPDLRQYRDQWIGVIHVFDRSGTFTYIDPDPSDGLAGTRLVLRRLSSTTIPGDGGEPYRYNPHGWTLEPGRPRYGYWKDICCIPFDAGKFIILDDQRVLNGWPVD
jgi:hypothetical protein